MMVLDASERKGAEYADRIGLLRFFGRADIRAECLLAGWAEPEDNHNWNDGPEIGYLLKLSPPPCETCILRVEGSAFIHERVPYQDITLYVNGLRLGAWHLTSAMETVLEAEIEPEQWLVRGDRAIGKVQWVIPFSTSPQDLGMGDDKRQLGFCFRSITVVPAHGI